MQAETTVRGVPCGDRAAEHAGALTQPGDAVAAARELAALPGLRRRVDDFNGERRAVAVDDHRSGRAAGVLADVGCSRSLVRLSSTSLACSSALVAPSSPAATGAAVSATA